MTFHGWSPLIAAVVGFVAASQSFAQQSVAEFYRGKQIEIVAGSEPGTSYDNWARMIAQFLPRHLPGRPSFIVRHMPGAGHIKATNYLYSVAPKDGTSMGIVSQLMPTASVLKNKPGLEADFTKFHFLGSTDRANQICVARVDAAIQDGADLFTKELTVGGAGSGSGVSAIPTFLSDILGMRFKLVEGYKSSVDVMLAIERREVDGMCQTYQGLLHTRPDAFASGFLKLLFNIESQPISGTNAPSVHKYIKDESQRALITFYSLNAEIGRPVILPPGTPPERVAALRAAFDAMSKDPEFLAEASRNHLDPNPISAAEMEDTFKRILATPPEVINRAAKFM